jgi:hypothetical protein
MANSVEIQKPVSAFNGAFSTGCNAASCRKKIAPIPERLK